MSTFFIYAIVLTLGYILYYAATITFDLTASKKTESMAEEKILMEDSSDDEDDEYQQRRVVENVETGGFSFLSPDTDIEEELEPPQEHILEEESITDVPESLSEGKEEEDNDNPPEEEIQSILPVLDVNQSEEHREDPPAPFDEQDAFNPELSQSRYDVTTFIEPQASEEIRSHADLVNNSLSSISRRGFLTDSFDLASIMKDKELRDKYNIDAKDEYTKV